MTACITSASSRGAANMATEQTSVRRSNEYATSSESSIPISPKSRITPHSGIDGEHQARPPPSWLVATRRIGASLTVKLVGLVGIFIALPVVLYGQFEDADHQ